MSPCVGVPIATKPLQGMRANSLHPMTFDLDQWVLQTDIHNGWHGMLCEDVHSVEQRHMQGLRLSVVICMQ
jgi:hypothetical protein